MRYFAFIPAVFIATAAVAGDPKCIEDSDWYRKHVTHAGFYCPCVVSKTDKFLTPKGPTTRITCVDAGEGAVPGEVDFHITINTKWQFVVSVADD